MRKGVMFEAVVTILILLLAFILYVMITAGTPHALSNWNVTIGGPAPYLFAGDNGTLYVFSGNNISMIGADGTIEWSLSAPENWTFVNEWTLPDSGDGNFPYFQSRILTTGQYQQEIVQTGLRPESEPAVASYNGILYVYVRPSLCFNNTSLDGNVQLGFDRALGPGRNDTLQYVHLMAISPDGRILWNRPLVNGTDESIENWLPIEDVAVSASKDRVYIYHPYSLTVLDSRGNFLYRLDNVSDPAAVDEQGDIFTVKAKAWTGDIFNANQMPSGTIVAYYPNGTVWWQKDMPSALRRQYLASDPDPDFRTLPVYENGILYVPLQKGLVALDPNGIELWSLGSKWDVDFLGQMPFDEQGDAYVTINTEPIPGSDSIYYQGARVTPAGNVTNFTIPQYPQYNGSLMSAYNGTGYFIYPNNWFDPSQYMYTGPKDIDDLISLTVTADDFRNGKELWEFTVPTGNPNMITLDRSNVRYLDEMSSLSSSYGFADSTANDSIVYNEQHPELQKESRSDIGPWSVTGAGTVNILPTDRAVYISYYMYNYEYPSSVGWPQVAVFNRSKLAYVSGILALDNNGRLLWNNPTDSLVTSMAVNNSTIYYSTKGGKLFATQSNAVIGFALLAIAYLFIRFFCVGAVARARNRTNANRSIVLRYVTDNPGSTLRDISRGLHMNIGTARYHMFILSLNHRILAYQADRKHIRYFINSGTYSEEEQLIMSIMRRDGMRKILGALLTKPGISNAQLADELGIQESAVSRYMRELADKGIVVKELAPMGTSAYFLSNERKAHVAKAMEIISPGP